MIEFVKVATFIANMALVLGDVSASDKLLLNHCGLTTSGTTKYMQDATTPTTFYTMDKANQIFCNVWLMNATGAGILDPSEGYAPLDGEKSTWTCDNAMALAKTQLSHDCGIGGATPGGTPPGPGPSPTAGSWSWASTTTDPTDDFTKQRFCGTDMSGQVHGGLRTGVSIPWGIICKKFGGKMSVFNYMCPDCPKDEQGVGGIGCGSAGYWAPNNWQNGNTKESILAADNGVYSNGVCYEVQPLKFGFQDFNPNEYSAKEGLYGGGAKSLDDDGVLADGWDSGKTVIAKLAVGCGGNCSANGQGDYGSNCPGGTDCINTCFVQSHGSSGQTIYDPCEIAQGPDICNYAKWGNEVGWNPDVMTVDAMVQHGSCPPLFDQDGNFTNVTSGFRNWCSGTHMHMDFTVDTEMVSLMGGTNFLVRYRPVVCPP